MKVVPGLTNWFKTKEKFEGSEYEEYLVGISFVVDSDCVFSLFIHCS